MIPDLEKLVHLQEAETAHRRVETERAELPRRRAASDAQLAQDRARLDAAREALAGSQKTRRQRETDLQDLEAKRSKYRGQLMDVKTNKEYTAMLHEIEGVERDIRGVEDQILAEMERAEGLAADVKREEAAFKEAEERHRVETRSVDERERVLAESSARIAAERDAVAGTLLEDLLTLFQRVARLRGTAVAEARDGTCEACHLKLRLQMYADLKKNDQILQCPGCSRVLYYVVPPPTVSPEP
jgi:predicted  nucleic acid-binding Zn-ribbon protein